MRYRMSSDNVMMMMMMMMMTTMMMIMTMIMMMVFITHITRNIGIYLDREVNENAKLSLLYGESCSVARFFNTPNQMHIILYICYIYFFYHICLTRFGVLCANFRENFVIFPKTISFLQRC